MNKKIDASKLTMNIRKDFKKPEDHTSLNNIETIVQNIHKPADAKEPIKRSTVELPKSLHKRIAQRLLDKDMTFKDYWIHLAEKDLSDNN